MGFLGDQSAPAAAPGSATKAPGTPLLSTLCIWLAGIELLAGAAISYGLAKDPNQSAAPALAAGAITIFGALILLGVAQTITFLARSAAAAERTAAAAERSARLLERREPPPPV